MKNNKFANSKWEWVNYKGFTLVELLAIIVILAIIVVIIIPKISDSIETSRRGAATTSAYGYRDSVNQYYLLKMAEPGIFNLDGNYMVGNKGILVQGNDRHEISFTGTPPEGGYLYVEDGSVESGCLTIGKYKVKLQNGEVATTEKGSCDEFYVCDESNACEKKYERIVDNVKYFNTEFVQSHPVYFNPVDGSICDEYAETNSNAGVNSGCMKWYAYSENQDGTVNMILDHNITTDKMAWVSKEDYNDSSLPLKLGVTYPSNNSNFPEYDEENGNNSKGPLTALNKLKDATNNYAESLTRSDNYVVNIKSINEDVFYSHYDIKEEYKDKNNITTQSVNYKIDYSGYKARLISIEEVANITGANESTDDGGVNFDIGNIWQRKVFFDGARGNDLEWHTQVANSTNKSKYAWLFDNITGCTSYGCNSEKEGTTYWTSSALASYRGSSWYLPSTGSLSYTFVNVTISIRPVITVEGPDAFFR